MLAPHQSCYSFIPITFVGHPSSTCCGLFRATNLFISMQPTPNRAQQQQMELRLYVLGVHMSLDGCRRLGAQCGNKRCLTGGVPRAGPPTQTSNDYLNDRCL